MFAWCRGSSGLARAPIWSLSNINCEEITSRVQPPLQGTSRTLGNTGTPALPALRTSPLQTQDAFQQTLLLWCHWKKKTIICCTIPHIGTNATNIMSAVEPIIGSDLFWSPKHPKPSCTFGSHWNLQMNPINILVAMQWRARARAIKEVKTKFLDEKRTGAARAFYNHLHKKKRNLKLRKEVVESLSVATFFGIVRQKDKKTKRQKYINTKRQF